MEKWNLIVDVEKCENCNNCFLSAVDEYAGNEFPGYTAPMPHHGFHLFDIQKKERGQAPMVDVAYVPTTCMHCDDAPCIAAAENGAVTKRDDGIVIIDPVKAKGQKQLVDSCPYGAIWWNEELELPQHWIFDAHLLDDGWKEPRCVQSCPTGALTSRKVEDADMARMIKEEGLEELRPDLNTKPRVHYKNLGLYRLCFIGGSVAYEHDGTADCLEGAQVNLSKDGKPVGSTTTDNYGDFKFDELEGDSGVYEVEISHSGYATKKVDATLGESLFLGDIYLEAP